MSSAILNIEQMVFAAEEKIKQLGRDAFANSCSDDFYHSNGGYAADQKALRKAEKVYDNWCKLQGAAKAYGHEKFVIFDIDGTLANIKNRLHHIKNDEGKKDWKSFNEGIPFDSLNRHIAAIYYALTDNKEYIPIICTGREETYRAITEKWLEENFIDSNLVFMREARDNRSDADIKREMMLDYFQHLDVLCVFDDRDRVVEVWRELGFKCLQVQKGDY